MWLQGNRGVRALGFWGVTEGRDVNNRVSEMQNIGGMHAAGLGMPTREDACNTGGVVLGGCTAQHCVHNSMQCGEDTRYGVGGMHATGSSGALCSIREMHTHHGGMHTEESRDAYGGGVHAVQRGCMPQGSGDAPHTMGPAPEHVWMLQSRRACGSWSGCRCRRQPTCSPVSWGPRESWPL